MSASVPERLAVLHRKKKSKGVKEMPNFFAAMQAVNQPLEPVFCGGNQRTLQEREQWASACNFFTVRPGVGITYARNEATLTELEHAGFRIVSAVNLLTGEESLDDGERVLPVFVAKGEIDMDAASAPIRDGLSHEGEQVSASGSHLPGHDLEQERIVGRRQRLPVAQGELELAVVVLGVDRFQFDAYCMSCLHDLFDCPAGVYRGPGPVHVGTRGVYRSPAPVIGGLEEVTALAIS